MIEPEKQSGHWKISKINLINLKSKKIQPTNSFKKSNDFFFFLQVSRSAIFGGFILFPWPKAVLSFSSRESVRIFQKYLIIFYCVLEYFKIYYKFFFIDLRRFLKSCFLICFRIWLGHDPTISINSTLEFVFCITLSHTNIINIILSVQSCLFLIS